MTVEKLHIKLSGIEDIVMKINDYLDHGKDLLDGLTVKDLEMCIDFLQEYANLIGKREVQF